MKKQFSTLKMVVRGPVTLANMRISAVAGTSFVDFSAANVLTDYPGHLLVVKDSAGRAIQGYIKAAGTGETYTEKVTNGNMETGDPPTGWEPGNGATLSAETVAPYAGSQSLKIVGDGSTDSPKATQNQEVLGSKLVKVSGVIKTGAFTGSISLYRGSWLYNTPLTYADWTLVTYYRTFPTAAGTMSVTLVAPAVNATIYVDSISCSYVDTPSTTGVTITSVKGGTAMDNWIAKNAAFNYNDTSGYTYEIHKVNNAVQVATGSLTAGLAKLSLVNDVAFADPTEVDLTPYADGRHILHLKDANGNVAFGHIKAAGVAETLGSELLLDPGFADDTKWTAGAGWTVGGTIATAVTAATDLTQTAATATTSKRLNKMSFDLVSRTAGTVRGKFDGYAFIGYNSVPATYNGYRTVEYSSSNAALGGAGFSGTVDNISVKQVLTPSATGVTVVSLQGGTVYRWTYSHPSFNPNIALTYKVLLV